MLAALSLAFLQDSPIAKQEDAAPFGPMEIGIAAKVLGLHFEEKELELMLPDVLERLKEFEMLRAVPLANDVAPALYFRPDLMVDEPRQVERIPLYQVGHSFLEVSADLEELAYANITTLREALEERQVSCLALTKMYLGRLKRLDEKLHCVITLTEERALRQAEVLDRELAEGKLRSNLHGLPWVAKDLLAVRGYPTTWGTTPFKEQVLDHDAAVVEKLDAAGAVLIAKVSLGELAWGDVWFAGKTRNPWKLEQGSSGSSAGTASAVAAGCAVFGIGSETYGSIVSPSTVCGNSSLRPTFGRVSRFGAMTLCWSLDKLGPICRSAEDALYVFDAIHGADPRDPTTITAPFGPTYEELKGIKIGVPKGAFDGDGAKCKQVLEELQTHGLQLVEIELPAYPVDEMMIVLAAEAGAAFDDFSRSDEDDRMVRQTRDAWPNVFRQAGLIPAVDYIRANRLRTLLIADYEKALAGVKAIVYPSFFGSLVAATNLSGHPTFVAPCGFNDDGTPYSISFTGKLFGDGDLLTVAMLWQKVSDYHLRHPKL